MDLGENLGENGIFGQVGPVTAKKVWCHGRLLNTNLLYTTNRLDWDKRESYCNQQDSNYDWIWVKNWVKMVIFGQVGPVTAQKVWCHGRLLNTNLFYTTNRLDWDKREPCRNHQDSNYDWIWVKNWVKMAFLPSWAPNGSESMVSGPSFAY